jgi:hypothetical protein
MTKEVGSDAAPPCMPCHPHDFTRPSAASLGTTSFLLMRDEAP